MDPFNADLEQAALERRLGVFADELRVTLDDYRSRNYAIRPNPEVPAVVSVEVPAVLVGEAVDVAQLQICEVNSWILVEVGAGPDGSDAIVNPDVISTRATVLLRNEGGTWKIEGANQLGRWEGEPTCPVV